MITRSGKYPSSSVRTAAPGLSFVCVGTYKRGALSKVEPIIRPPCNYVVGLGFRGEDLAKQRKVLFCASVASGNPVLSKQTRLSQEPACRCSTCAKIWIRVLAKI